MYNYVYNYAYNGRKNMSLNTSFPPFTFKEQDLRSPE